MGMPPLLATAASDCPLSAANDSGERDFTGEVVMVAD